MDRRLKQLREAWALSEAEYSADVLDSPVAKYGWSKSEAEREKLYGTRVGYVPVAIFPDGSSKPMVNPKYGYDTVDDAQKAGTKILGYPAWAETDKIRIDVYAGDLKVGEEPW